MRHLLAVCLLCVAALLTASVRAEEKPACEQFAWSLSDEKAWFDDANITLRTSGDNTEAVADGAFSIGLKAESEITFVLPPEGKPKDGAANGAIVTFANVPQAGRYQVTLSDEAWIDMIQEGKYVPSVEHTGVKGCEGLRKSVRFDLASGSLTLQLSRSPAVTLRVAIRHVH
jgi:hypothetical protein